MLYVKQCLNTSISHQKQPKLKYKVTKKLIINLLGCVIFYKL